MSWACLSWGCRRWDSWISSRIMQASCRISQLGCLGLPSRVLFRSYHMHHAIVTMSSSSFVPTCWKQIRCQSRYMKSLQWMPLSSKEMPESVQISRALVQSQKSGLLLSAAKLQASQFASSRTYRRQRLVFVGKVSRHAFHVQVLILFGILRLHIVCQNELLSCPWEVLSEFVAKVRDNATL